MTELDRAALADVLKRRAHVRGEPVGISLFAAQIPAAYEGRRVEPCAIVHRAMDLGEICYVDAEHQDCLAGAWQAGFLDPPEPIKTGRYLADGIPGFSPLAAERVKGGINVLPPGTARAIGAAPLARVPADVAIDVLVVVCEPVHAATLGGVRTTIDGTPPRGAAGTSLCGELFAVPWHEGNVIVTPGDMGGRMFNKIKPNEMFVIIPIRFAEHLFTLLEATPDVPALMESIKPGHAAARATRLADRAERRRRAPVWDPDVRALLARAPAAIAEFAEPTLEAYASEHGHARITMEVVRAQMASVGMRLEDVMDVGVPIDVDDAAPVVARASVSVCAPIEEVWRVISDVQGWPGVYPEVREAALDGPLQIGAGLRFKAGPAAIAARVEALEEPIVLKLSGRAMGATSTFVFRIERDGDTAVLHLAQSMSGTAVRAMRPMLQRVADTSVHDWAAAIAARAEGRS